MTNITFTQTFTFTEESVKEFAVFLGWQEKLTRQIEVVDDDTTTPPTVHFNDEQYTNPESFVDFVNRLAKEHSLKFTKQYAEKLKEDHITAQVETLRAEIEPISHEQIVKPVEDALSTSYTTE